jgi:hypothetical protein
MCYNYDSTTNILGWSGTAESTTTAEGSQNEGKYLRVENPVTANLQWFAGVVAEGGWCGQTVANGSSLQLDVYEPTGAIVPVKTSASCTVGSTVLGLITATYVMAATPTAPCALVEETVDRSGTNGLVLAKLFPTGQVITGTNMVLSPTRGVTTGDASGLRMILDNLYTGAGEGGPRTWGLYITGDKESGAISVAGADDAAIRVSVNNYVANTSVFNFRGINIVASNRDGGVLGGLTNIVSISLKQGSTTDTAIGLQVDAQDLAATAKTEFGGLDVAINREGLAATTEYGIQIRTRGTINTAIDGAIRVDMQATDYGFANLFTFDANAAVSASAAAVEAAHVLGFDGDGTAIKIPIKVGSTTYYLLAGTATALVADA